MAQIGPAWQAFTHTDKGDGLATALKAAGHKIQRRDGVFYTTSDPATVEAFISSYDGVASAKAAKSREIAEYSAGLRKAFLEAAGFSVYEGVSFGTKLAEAARYVSEPADLDEATTMGIRMLYREAQMTGATVANIRARVEANAAALQDFEGQCAGARAVHLTAVAAIDEGNEAATIVAVQAYDYSTGWPV